MRAIWSLLLVLAATVVFTGQEPPHAIRVDVQMVSLDVGVFDAGGRPVLDLRKEDFLIFEDGQPQEIRYFAPAGMNWSWTRFRSLSSWRETERACRRCSRTF